MKSVNPATLQLIREYSEHTESAVDQAIVRAAAAFPAWRDAGFERRAAVLRGVARLLRDEKREHAELMTREMGKPIAAGRSRGREVRVGLRLLRRERRAASRRRRRSPPTRARATCASIRSASCWRSCPGISRYWQVFRFAAPALMAGNVGVLKHASNVPRLALAIEEPVSRTRRAGRACSRRCSSPPSAVGMLVDAPEIAAVTLTGSEAAGRALAAARGRHVKKIVLELGGSDPFMVLGDADLDAAAAEAVKARVDQLRSELHRRQTLHRRGADLPSASKSRSSRR